MIEYVFIFLAIWGSIDILRSVFKFVSGLIRDIFKKKNIVNCRCEEIIQFKINHLEDNYPDDVTAQSFKEELEKTIREIKGIETRKEE